MAIRNPPRTGAPPATPARRNRPASQAAHAATTGAMNISAETAFAVPATQ
ncbi:hypothetical protein [Streptomyces lonarensis]|uniref:Uncharacterized protein n=1 Tax=Streptomyces lonarensis TaxID=700599 RepID=A0A7X6HZ04_9ACTN|nr:hypothetical protein [Streptomyces lonarensis]NJQ06148.1 hypothetical protein [Streptomyces lonarensis]